MKKRLLFLVILVLFFSLSGCKEEEEKRHQVSFYQEEVLLESVTVKSGKKIVRPISPTKDGFLFLGWYFEGEEFDFETLINSDLNLLAKFNKIENNSPIFKGLDNKTIIKGSNFYPLEGVTAYDLEDGDLTNKIEFNGSVDLNNVGDYQLVYRVFDSDLNKTEVEIVVRVIEVDDEQPIIIGVKDEIIGLGEEIDLLSGISAYDNVDGNLTKKIIVTGSLDSWQLGNNVIRYRVLDNSGNETIKERNILVSLGSFLFNGENILKEADLNLTNANYQNNVLNIKKDGLFKYENIIKDLSSYEVFPYYLFKLTIKAKANKETSVDIKINNSEYNNESLNLTTNELEYQVYYKLSKEETSFDLVLTVSEDVKIEFSELKLELANLKDEEAPLLTVPLNDLYLPINDLKAFDFFKLRGVSALDNIDGDLTDKIVVDADLLNFSEEGEYPLIYQVTDSAGNTACVNRTVYMMSVYDTRIITDPEFNSGLNSSQFKTKTDGNPIFKVENEMLIHKLTTKPGYESADSPYLTNITTDQFKKDNWYLLKFDIKADQERLFKIRAGLELYDDPWMEDFYPNIKPQYQITTSFKTIYYLFYLEKEKSSAGSKTIKLEIQLGKISGGNEEVNNTVYLDNMQFYLLSFGNEEPLITNKGNIKTTFALNSVLPNFKNYIDVYDKEDGKITVTDEMVDISNIEVDKVGSYDVIYDVTDSGGKTVSHTITIKIIKEEDESPPVISEVSGLEKEFEQFSNEIIDFKSYVTIYDNVDGEIEVSDQMIDLNGFNLNKAGTYTVKYQVYDSSLNKGYKEISFEVIDKEAPFIYVDDLILSLNSKFDPFAVLVNDNCDGVITLNEDNVSGYEDFIEDGVVNKVGEFTLFYQVTDSNNNKASKEIVVEVADIDFNEEIVIDLLEKQLEIDNDGAEIEALISYPNNGAKITYFPRFKYASYSKLKYQDLSLQEDTYYQLVFKAKAQNERDILIHFYDSSGSEVKGFLNKKIVRLEKEYQTYQYLFYIESNDFYTLEIQFGYESYLFGVDGINIIEFEELKIISEDTITVNPNLEKDLTFLINDESPLWNDYLFAYDSVDGFIEITNEMIDDSLVDFSKVGNYQVIYKITNSRNKEVTYYLNIKVTLEYEIAKTFDLLALKKKVSNDGSEEATYSYDNNNVLTVNYRGAVGYYASYSKIKYENDLKLKKGVKYKFLIEAKALKTRDIVISFKRDTGDVVYLIPGFDVTLANKKDVLLLNLTSSYQIYEVEFEAPTSGAYKMEVQFGHEGFFNNTLNANVITIKQMKVIPELGEDFYERVFDPSFDPTTLTFDEKKAVNVLSLKKAISNDYDESVGVYNADGSLTVSYTSAKGGSWTTKLKPSAGTFKLEGDKYYRFVFEAKAETARQMTIKLKDNDGVIIGFDTYLEKLLLVDLENDYQTFEVYFYAEMSGNYELEVQFGYERDLVNSGIDNTIDIKRILFIPEAD